MGLFDRLLPPTDHVDEIVSAARAQQQRISTERYHERRNNDLDGKHAYLLEKKKHTTTELDLRKEKEKNAELENENIRLKQERDRLEAAAVKIAVDRRALLNTIGYLSQKWKKPEQTEDDIAQEAQRFREDDAQKSFENPEGLEKIRDHINQIGDPWLPQVHNKIGKKKK